MKRILFMAVLVSVAAFACAAALDMKRDPDIVPDELLRHEKNIIALNLINSLYMTEYQLGQVLDILYDLDQLKQEYADSVAGEISILEEKYAALEEDLIDDDMVKESSEREAAAQKGKIEKMAFEYKKKVYALNEQLMNIFDEKQKEILEGYQPCVIPPKNDNNTRIGQEGGTNTRALQYIRYLRNMERWEFESTLSHRISESIRHMEMKKGVYSDEERRREIARLTDLAWEIYEMDNVEFEIRKNELAEQTKPMMPQQAQMYDRYIEKSTAPGRVEKKYDLDVAGRVLLDTELIEVLEKKMRNM